MLRGCCCGGDDSSLAAVARARGADKCCSVAFREARLRRSVGSRRSQPALASRREPRIATSATVRPLAATGATARIEKPDA